MANLISFTTPLPAGGTATSNAQYISRAVSVTGTVYTDQPGTLYIDQGGDGINWDSTTSVPVPNSTILGVGTPFTVNLIAQYFQVRYVNGGIAQTTFRCYANPRDPYGAFLAKALPPSMGGMYAVLWYNQSSGTYQYVGRYDGADELGAITSAVNYKGVGGKYAAFNVNLAVVSDETPVFSTEHSPDSF